MSLKKNDIKVLITAYLWRNFFFKINLMLNLNLSRKYLWKNKYINNFKMERGQFYLHPPLKFEF